MKKYFLNAIEIISITILQISLINGLIYPFNHFNLFLPFITIFIILDNYNKAINWAFWGGLFLGIFSFNRFGLDALVLLSLSLILNILYHNFFTNTSLFSSIFLGIIASLLYHSIQLIFINFYFYLKLSITIPKNFMNLRLFLVNSTIELTILTLLYIIFFTSFFTKKFIKLS